METERLFFWPAIDRIEVGNDHAFIFTSSITAIPIPKRDLEPQVFDQFVAKVEEYLYG